jgi:hypothetical protein
MRWNDIAPERKTAIIESAAAQLTVDDDEARLRAPVDRVTVADLADFARGRPLRCGQPALQQALRADLVMRETFDLLFDRYALVSLPPAIAASSGAPRRRRQADAQVEVEWVQSSAEPDTVFVRVYAPSRMRPVSHLMLRGDDGTLCKIALADDGAEEVIEALVDRRSPEFHLLQNEAARLWLQ